VRDWAAVDFGPKVKPVVRYKPTEADAIERGKRAALFNVLDHPSDLVSNTEGTMVGTSRVLYITEDGFETENTRYVREK
jgi:hypothetical protein